MVSTAYAAAETAAPTAQATPSPWANVIMLVVMFAIFYFLLIRPQQKRAKEHKELVDNLKIGDQVVTAGGVHGKVAALLDDTVMVEIATGVKVKLNRSAIVFVKSE